MIDFMSNAAFPVGLAPMAGTTDACFRAICLEYGCDFAVTEMLSAKGYLYSPKERRQTLMLLLRAEQEKNTGLQLFGSDPDLVSEAANQLSDMGFAFIDVNMGCPAPKIVSGGEGSALLKTPDLAARIVEATVARTRLPVTVKMRAGWDQRNICAVDFARRMAGAGAKAIALHARTRDQFYGGAADWGLIEKVKSAVSVPVIGNGDIASGADAVRMKNETGCDGIMIGRCAQGNPWIFREARAALRGENADMPAHRERLSQAHRHLTMMAAAHGHESAVVEMRKHIAWYIKGFPGGAKMRARINAMKTVSEVRAQLTEWISEGC